MLVILGSEQGACPRPHVASPCASSRGLSSVCVSLRLFSSFVVDASHMELGLALATSSKLDDICRDLILKKVTFTGPGG